MDRYYYNNTELTESFIQVVKWHFWRRHVKNGRSHLQQTLSCMQHSYHAGALQKHSHSLSCTYRSRAELKTGEKQDLSYQNSKGQIRMDMIALVADGAHRPGRRQKYTLIRRYSKKHEHIYDLSESILFGFWSLALVGLSQCLLSTFSARTDWYLPGFLFTLQPF